MLYYYFYVGCYITPTLYRSTGERKRHKVPLRTLFQVQAGTWVEPPMFRKLAGYLSHMEGPKSPAEYEPAAMRGKCF